MSRSCKYLFTCFKMDVNWKEVFEFKNKKSGKQEIRYIIANHEKCPKTGKEHYNGYVQFYKACRYAKFQKIIDEKCYCQIPCGTDQQNIDYCSKLKTKIGETYEFGIPTHQGKRNDLLKIQEDLENGMSMRDISYNNFSNYVRYHKGFGKYKNLMEKEKRKGRRMVEVILITGKTGTGKTRKVMDDEGDDNVYIVEFDSGKQIWWDGYEGENVILLDDYDNNFKCNRLLKILDWTKLRVQVKGDCTYANWHKVYITTNLRLDEIHPNAKDEHRVALFRRFDKVIDYWENGTKCLGNTNQTDESDLDFGL